MSIRVTQAEFVLSAAAPSDWPEEGVPEVAFCGRSNVGKSSLIKTLTGRKGLVRTSRTPGRTRLTNFFDIALIDIAGRLRALRMVDLPGFGYAKVSKTERATWRPAIENYLGRRQSLVAVVLLVDARRGAEREEKELVPWIGKRGVTVIPVLTKSDKLAKHERPVVLDRARAALGALVIATSVHGEGCDRLWERIAAALPSVS